MVVITQNELYLLMAVGVILALLKLLPQLKGAGGQLEAIDRGEAFLGGSGGGRR